MVVHHRLPPPTPLYQSPHTRVPAYIYRYNVEYYRRFTLLLFVRCWVFLRALLPWFKVHYITPKMRLVAV